MYVMQAKGCLHDRGLLVIKMWFYVNKGVSPIHPAPSFRLAHRCNSGDAPRFAIRIDKFAESLVLCQTVFCQALSEWRPKTSVVENTRVNQKHVPMPSVA